MAVRPQTPPPRYSPFPEEPVRFALMEQTWEQLTFLHWKYDPERVQRLLPRGLEVETYHGAAWVALTPFFARVRPPHFPALFSVRFPETNVRTYVRGPGGKPGVWFFSLDAGRRWVARAARASYRLPYMWSRMSVQWAGTQAHYSSRRLWPGPGPASDIAIEIDSPFTPVELGEFDYFLTSRWRLFSRFADGRLAEARVEHRPWPLARARVLRLDEDLLAAAGLPRPEGPPLVHYSPGVDVRVGPPVLL